MTHEPLLKDLIEKFTYASDRWQPLRQERALDLKYLAGDSWDSKERQAREDAKRPCLNFDELNQHVNQLINDIRQNKRAIKVSPEGNQATTETAQLRANLIRQIEYKSRAQMAYIGAVEDAIQGSYGFYRITSQYADDRSDLRELRILPLPNPDLVTIDPDFVMPDGSDLEYAFIAEPWLVTDFQKKFKGAKVQSFSQDMVTGAPLWFPDKNNKKILLAEYWYYDETPRKLVRFTPNADTAGRGLTRLNLRAVAKAEYLYEDEIAERDLRGDTSPVRDVTTKSVKQCLTNGQEILSTTSWPGKYIPIVPVLGKILYLDQGSGVRRVLLSLIRLARDPQMYYNYLRTCEAEVFGQSPKTRYIGYKGQFRGVEQDWQKANYQPTPYLEVLPSLPDIAGGQVLPHPTAITYEPPIQAFEIGAESARRGIQAAVGSAALPTQAQKQNEKSGVALARIEHVTQKGSYHFIDHFEQALTFGGLQLDDLLDKIYDTEREVAIRKPDDTPAMIWINKRNPQKPGGLENPLSIGTHDVTISTGPSFDSEREKAESFADTLASNPAIFALIGDLVVKMKELGPIGDEIAARLTPPQFRKPPNMQDLPAEAQQAFAQMAGELQQVQQLLQQAAQTIQTKKVELESKERIAAADRASREKIALVQGETQLSVTAMKADMDAALTLLQTQMEHIEAELGRTHDARQAVLGQAPEQGMLGAQGELDAEAQRQAATQAVSEAASDA